MTTTAEAPSAESSIHSQIERWQDSYRAFAEDLLQVQTTEGTIVPLRFNNVQIALDEIINDAKAQGRYTRFIIDKLRRTGCSTYLDGRGYWYTNLNPHTNALIVTHEPEATDTIFGMTKRFYALMPKKMKPQVLYDNRKALVFNTKDRVGGLDSEIKVGTAGKENFGSSQMVNFAHFSEFSKWNASVIDDLMTSLMPTIPRTMESELFIESTANGIGNKYHQMWLAARYHYEMYLDEAGDLKWRLSINTYATADNTWNRVFIPWFVFEKCKMPIARWERQTGQKFELTKEEEEFVELHLKGCARTVALQKMAWYRQVLVDDFQGDKRRRAQEYPSTWQESFMSSGEMAFDAYYCQLMLEITSKEERDNPCIKYEVDPVSGQFMSSKTGRLWVWEEFKPGEAYVIIADISKGIVVNDKVSGDQKHDASTCSIKHHLTGREVAQWWGYIDPDLFGQLLYHLHKRYGDAWVIPENNGPGNTTISALLRRGCKKIYVERVIEPPNKPRKRYGFSTTGAHYVNGTAQGVRAEAVNAFIAKVRDKRALIRSPRTWGEMLTFKRDEKGKYKAELGCKDDTVIVECITAFAVPLLPLPAMLPVVTSTDLNRPAVPRNVPAMSTHAQDGWT